MDTTVLIKEDEMCSIKKRQIIPLQVKTTKFQDKTNSPPLSHADHSSCIYSISFNLRQKEKFRLDINTEKFKNSFVNGSIFRCNLLINTQYIHIAYQHILYILSVCSFFLFFFSFIITIILWQLYFIYIYLSAQHVLLL